MLWIWLSLIAAFFFAIRHVIIKKYLSNADVLLTAFIYRFFSILYLLPLLFFYDLVKIVSIKFWIVTLFTAILTAGASIMQIKALQKYDLSSSVPFLAFVPLFMILPVYFLFHEVPDLFSFFGVILLSAGAIVINSTNKNGLFLFFRNFITNKGSILFFGVAIIYGISTTYDRVAILEAENSGFTYTFYWHVISVFLFSLIFLNFKKIPFYISDVKNHIKGFALQAFFGIAAFFMQMLAVEFAKNVNANVLYIKAITLFQLLVSVFFGIILFKEKNAIYRIIGAFAMIIGAIIIIIVS